VAAERQVTPQTIRNWIDHGALAAVRIGRAFRVRRADVEDLLERASADSTSLATRRNLWEPTTTTLRRRSEFGSGVSVWDDRAEPAPPVKSS
jgi:excisionase family DNA binding protein